MLQLMIAVGALICLGATRLGWIEFSATDDKLGDQLATVTGATVVPELTAAALALLAGAVVAAVLKGTGRRIVGLALAVLAIASSYQPMKILTSGMDTAALKELLTAAAADNKGVHLSDWAQITAQKTVVLGPAVALLGCALVLIASVALARKKQAKQATTTKYAAGAVKHERVAQELAENPDNERVLWDALDHDLDPTASEKPAR